MCEYSGLIKYHDRKSAEEEYFKYLNSHKILINNAFSTFGKAFTNELNVNYDDLKKLIEVHDASKWVDKTEIDGYLANFYPYDGDGMGLDEFGIRRALYEKGLLHHFNTNPHHPEYWVFFHASSNRMDCKPMERIYVCEMVIDWIANERNDNLSVHDYWSHNRGCKFIHSDTIQLVDLLIELVTKIRGE